MMLGTYSNGSFSIPSLLIPGFPHQFTNTESPSIQQASPSNQRWHQSKFFLIDQLVDSAKFDILFIETVPIYKSVDGSLSLLEESKVWLPDFKTELGEELLKAWYSVNACMTKSKISTFFHPSFTGFLHNKSKYFQWGEGRCSAFSDDNGYFHEGKYDKKVFEKYQARFNAFSKSTDVEDPLHINGGLDMVFRNVNFESEFGYSYGTLASLLASHAIDYYNALTLSHDKNLERLPEMDAFEYSHSLNSDRTNKFGSLLGTLVDPSTSDKVRKRLENLLDRDLDLCILTAHRELDTQFQKILGKKFNCSVVLSLPLIFQQFENSLAKRDGLDELPPTYRGGVWIYAASSSELTLDQEAYLEKIARFSWLLFMDRYTLEISENSKLREQIDFAHQTYGLVESVLLGLRRTGALEKLPTGVKQALFVLQETIGSYRNARHDHSRDAKLTSDLQSHVDLAAWGALERLRDNKIQVRCYLNQLDQFEQSNQPAQALLKFTGFQTPVVPNVWEHLIQKESFGMMLYHMLWQALYHSVCWKVDHPETMKLPTLLLAVTDGTVTIQIENPGAAGERKFSKDSRTLRELGSKFGATDVFGPVWQEKTQAWVTGCKFVLAEVGWSV